MGSHGQARARDRGRDLMSSFERVDRERHDQAEDGAAAHRSAQRLLAAGEDLRLMLDTVLDHAVGVTLAQTPAGAMNEEREMEAAVRRLVDAVGEWT